MITQNIIDLVKKHEGLRLHKYPDTNGYYTIGYGHLIKQSESFDTITQEEANSLLLSDLNQAERDARSLFLNYDKLCEARQAALVDMAFNLGRTELSGFIHFIQAINDNNFVLAAYDMKSSLWYRQVGVRSAEDRELILTGEFQ